MKIIKRITEKIFGLEPEVCESCETLRLLLESERQDKTHILEALIEASNSKPVVQEAKPVEDLKPLSVAPRPWRVRQQMLENEDRQKARILSEHKQSTEELERELGIDDQATNG